MPAKKWLKGLVHQELFALEPSDKQIFRYSLANDRLHEIFTQNGHSLGSDVTFQTTGSRNWKLLDRKKVYLVKDLGDRLVVIGEKHPRICRLLESVLYGTTARFREFRGRVRWFFLQESLALKSAVRKNPVSCLSTLEPESGMFATGRCSNIRDSGIVLPGH